MSLLTGKDETESSAMFEIVEEIGELEAQVKAISAMQEAEQKARIDNEKTLRAELGKLADVRASLAFEQAKCEQLEQENTSLKRYLEDERKEHAETRRMFAKIQDSIAGLLKHEEKEEEVGEVSFEIVRRDENGRTRKIVMKKG